MECIELYGLYGVASKISKFLDQKVVFFDEHYWNTVAKEVDCRVTEIQRFYQ